MPRPARAAPPSRTSPLGDVLGDPLEWPELEAAEFEQVLARANALGAVTGSATEKARMTATAAAGAAAAILALDARLTRERGDQLVEWAARAASLSADDARVDLFLHALLEIVARAAAPAEALEGILRSLSALVPAAVAVEVAGERLNIEVGVEPDAECRRVPIPGAEAALLVEPAYGAEARCDALADIAARVARATLPAHRARGTDEVAKLDAAQRRLRRLALDLHDGPAQDVAALVADAALLEADLSADPSPESVRAAREVAAELRARLTALGRDIRDLAEVLEPRAMLREPLRDVLLREVARFTRRSGITTTVDLDHDFGVMTASQQIALARVAQEALRNVLAHADATKVQLTARASERGVVLVVEDDGRGFDVARAKRSARKRLGLVGMEERVRMLGGTLGIESRKGGPTRVEAVIPRWRPSA
jgi:signal transduction histidine kinase